MRHILRFTLLVAMIAWCGLCLAASPTPHRAARGASVAPQEPEERPVIRLDELEVRGHVRKPSVYFILERTRPRFGPMVPLTVRPLDRHPPGVP